MVVVVASSFVGVEAKIVASTKALPDYIEASIAMMYQNAPASRLAEVRAEWTAVLELKQQRIIETGGAVLNFQPSLLTDTGSYMATYLPPPESFPAGGTQQITNPANTVGLIDYAYTRFYTPGLNQGVGVKGILSNLYSYGDVYVYAKLGPTGAQHTGNLIFVYASNSTADWSWDPIGVNQVTYPYNWPYAAYVYIGHTLGINNYEYVVVCTGTTYPGWEYNDVLGDMVWFTNQ